MTFHPARAARLTLQICALVVVTFTGCRRPIPEEEKAVRAELRQALSDKSYGRAVDLAQRVVSAAPHENGAWERLVRAQLGADDVMGAKETLTVWRSNVRKLSPKHHEYYGDIARAEGNTAAAVEAWSKALLRRQNNVRVLRKITAAHHSREAWKEEEAALSKILAIHDEARSRIERALCRRRMHRWTEAQEDFRRAQELNAADPAVQRATALFERLGKFLAEIREIDARLAVTPDDDQLLTDRALLFLRGGDAELALEDSAAAAKMASWAMRPRLFQAIALIELGRANECEKLAVDERLQLSALSPEFLETISRADSDISVERSNAELYVTRAWQLNDIGQPALALEDAMTAQHLDPKLASASVEGSYALAKLGRSDEALEQIQRATELDANYATGWQYRGELEMTRGDHAAAIESLTRALEINETPAMLEQREECYVRTGLLAKAEEDHRAREALMAGTAVQPPN